MKQPPKGAIFEKMRMKKCDFYQAALQRLVDDVGNILQLVDGFNRNSERKIGFWSSIRLLMPIIEAVASVSGQKPQELLKNNLDVKTPYLAWDLFRHSLMHGDYLQHAKYKNKKVGWGVSLMGAGHIVRSGHIGIDTPFLYQKLKEYLESEVAKNDQTIVEIEVGVLYQSPKQEIIDDFVKL